MASLREMREANRALLLRALHRAGCADRAELARVTGLSRATVSGLLGEAIAAGHVVEQPRSNGGSASGMLSVNPRGGIVVGVDLGHSHVGVVLADLAATVIVERRAALDVDAAAGVALDTAASLVAEAVADSGVDRERLIGVGMGVPGPLDRATGTVRSSSILVGWAGIRPAEALAERLAVPVRAENDANLGALAEHACGAARGVDDVAYLKLSTGVGAGLLFGGRLYVGGRGTAGEIGHVRAVPGGTVCRCGHRGCLETVASARALTGADEQALADAGRHVGRALALLCMALDVELVVVGGELGASSRLVGAVRSELRRTAVLRKPVKVRPGLLGERAEGLGGVALALAQEDWLRAAGVIALRMGPT